MKAIRSMVLVSGDEVSLKHGALEVFNALQKQLAAFGLEEEITVSMVNDVNKPGLGPPGVGISGCSDFTVPVTPRGYSPYR